MVWHLTQTKLYCTSRWEELSSIYQEMRSELYHWGVKCPGNKNGGQEHWPEQIWAGRVIVHHGKATRLSTIKEDMKQMPTCSCWTWLGSGHTGSPWGALIHPLHLLPGDVKGSDGQEHKAFLPPCHTPALASAPSLQSLAFALIHYQTLSLIYCRNVACLFRFINLKWMNAWILFFY